MNDGINLNRLVAAYVRRRDRLRELEQRHKETTGVLRAEMDKLERAMHALMAEQGVERVKTPAGTAYMTTWTRTQVEDWDAVLGYIRANEAWDLLQRNVNKSAVLERSAEGDVVPGVRVERGKKINVRRA